MDQIKVGNYIATKRKNLGLTQKELAELVEVTDKSISKWERGNGLPDVTRLKPLCDALKISMNELIAGEDIGEEVLSMKTEENIMSLIKDNETQKKKSGVTMYIIGAILAILAFCLLGVSIEGSSMQAVLFYLDPIGLLFLALFIGIGVLFGNNKTKEGVWMMIQKLSIPASVFISLFEAVLVLASLSDISNLGPSLAVIILVPLYGVAIYIVASIVRTHMDETN